MSNNDIRNLVFRTLRGTFQVAKLIAHILMWAFITAVVLVVIAHVVPSTVEAMPYYGEVVTLLEGYGNNFFMKLLQYLS